MDDTRWFVEPMRWEQRPILEWIDQGTDDDVQVYLDGVCKAMGQMGLAVGAGQVAIRREETHKDNENRHKPRNWEIQDVPRNYNPEGVTEIFTTGAQEERKRKREEREDEDEDKKEEKEGKKRMSKIEQTAKKWAQN